MSGLLGLVLLPTLAAADGITLNNEFNYTTSDSTTTFKDTNETLSGSSETFKQRYNLDLFQSIYPYLTFKGGALYQGTDSTFLSADTEAVRREKLIRPFADLNLESPLVKAGVGVRKTQIDENATGNPDTTNERDEFNSFLGWRPLDLPEVNLRVGNIHSYNNLNTLDSVYRQVNFGTKYTAWRDLRLNYFLNRAETRDDIHASDIVEQAQNAMADYSHSFWNNRLAVSTGYRVRHYATSVTGTASLELPVSRSQGFSALDNNPLQNDFSTNNPLIDGDRTVSTGLDIGLGGDEGKLTQMVIDFGFPVSVDTIHLWVDRRLPAGIVNAFSWSIYISPGTLAPTEWSLWAVKSPAAFAPLDNRFEFSFPAATTRYIKVVTRPISIAVPNTVEFPNIFVTEMETFSARMGTAGLNQNTSLDQDYNLDLNSRVTDRTSLGYHFFFRTRKDDFLLQKRTEYSNGIFVNHTFNEMFVGNTSLLRTESQNAGKDNLNYTFAASLRANYLETLDQTLTYSSLRETDEEENVERNSLILRTNAKLYKGVDAFLDNGYSINKTVVDQNQESVLVRMGTNIVPNEKLTMNTNYTLNRIVRTEILDRKKVDSQLDFQVFLTPLSVLSLTARVSLVERDNKSTTYQNFSVNWLPFPEGALQFFVVYTEDLTPEDNKKERTLNPGLLWKISRHVNLTTAYNHTRSETNTTTTEANSLNALLRLIF